MLVYEPKTEDELRLLRQLKGSLGSITYNRVGDHVEKILAILYMDPDCIYRQSNHNHNFYIALRAALHLTAKHLDIAELTNEQRLATAALDPLTRQEVEILDAFVAPVLALLWSSDRDNR